MKTIDKVESGIFFVVFIAIVAALIVTVVNEAKINIAQVLLTFALVLITFIYAKRTVTIADATRHQADASMKMAKEMSEQRIMSSRPIIVQKVQERAYDSDNFEIFNIGNGPAIELEIRLLNNEKKWRESDRETFLIQNQANPRVFSPTFTDDIIGCVCYIVSQYRSVDTTHLWYQTWLPFIPKKSQTGDRVIITPQELEFRKVNKKESFE